MRRRTFLLAGVGAAGALVVGWALRPPRQRLMADTGPAGLDADAVALNGWVAIAPDDTVTVIVPKAEMGQGAHTALAMLVAEELGCDWARVRVTPAPIDAIYRNVVGLVDALPLHPDAAGPAARTIRWMSLKSGQWLSVMITGGSSSVRDCWMPMREAGASARTALVAAAAARAGVAPSACRVEDGVVVAGAQRFRYGELLAEAAHHRPARVTLKPLAEATLLGRPVGRLDSAAKARGAGGYAIDVRLPGLLQAAVTLSPTFGGRPAAFDRAAALRVAGVRAVVPLAGSAHGDAAGVAVVAESWWQARQGIDALGVTWEPGPHAALDGDAVLRALDDAVADEGGVPFRAVGDADAAFARAARTIERTYRVPYLAHATMEPPGATVRVTDAGAEAWLGTQAPEWARRTVARVLDIDVEAVTLHLLPLGGGFGRFLDTDVVAQAAAIARAVPGVPVKLTWSREDDLRHDFLRPASVGRLRAALDADGALTAVAFHAANQAPFKQLSRRNRHLLTSHAPDRYASEGAWDQPYEFAAFRATHREVTLPVPVGSWRGVGHTHQAFFLELFLDEVAEAMGVDPAALRRSLLQRHARARGVLELALARSGWGTPPAPAPDGQPVARGLAMHWNYGTTVAQVAEVSRAPDGRVRVHRVVAAVDCGFVVNPNLARQQLEGGILDGVGAALHGAVPIHGGGVLPGNFDAYRLLRLAECPDVEVHFVPSMEEPWGIGEAGLPAAAPAVANALSRLTGERVRTLPLGGGDAAPSPRTDSVAARGGPA